MPSITVHPPSRSRSDLASTENPLPELLHTPSGLAMLEIQGTIHFPTSAQSSTRVGKLVFPLYNPTLNDPSDTKWMKRVYMYIGNGQRMTGECKKLGKPIGVVRKREKQLDGDVDMNMSGVIEPGEEEQTEQIEELEIVEVVKYKIVFSSRPEPISGVAETG